MKIPALAALLMASAIGTASAQVGPRPFHDSWFWGVYGGAASYYGVNTADLSQPTSVSVAPEVGGDWLITRKTGGLYVSFAQSFASTTGVILNGPTSADTGFRFVDVKNLRRFNMALMAYPGDFVKLHPYVGVGVAFDYIPDVAPQFQPTDTDKQVEFAASTVSDVKAALGPLFIAGAQYRLFGVSAFGQATVSSRAKDFLMANGNQVAVGFQLGLRYNIGTSIERNY